ncbi:MAG: Por secretion system C-terminal sorting protein [Ignavibacteria bacterium]|nr:Por secretion system C-terminal sorting protein [Ignavibacteria bacterium]
MKRLFLLALLLTAIYFLLEITAHASSPKNILIEEATNASCGPCATQNPSFQKFLDGYPKSKVIPLIYHSWWPGPTDPMFLNDTLMNQVRIKYYAINGVPGCRLDGDTATPSSGWYTGAPGDIAMLTKFVETNLNATSPATIEILQERNGDSVSITITVSSDEAITGQYLRVAATEYFHNYTNAGNNGEKDFYWLARKMFPDATGTLLDIPAGGSKSFNFSYILKPSWNKNSMYVVAFIQDDATKKIMQSSSNLEEFLANVKVESISKTNIKIDQNSSGSTDINIKNPNKFQCDFTVSINSAASIIPKGWNVTFEPNTLTLQPNETKPVTVTFQANNNPGFCVASLDISPSSKYISIPINQNIAVLSSGIKNVILTGGTNAVIPLQTMMSFPALSANTTVIPLSETIIDNFPLKNFDFALLSINYFNVGTLTGLTSNPNLSKKLLASLKEMIKSGKSLLIMAEREVYNAYMNSGTMPEGKEFINKTLGIIWQGECVLRVKNKDTVNPKPTQFGITGFENDPYFRNLSYQLNEYDAQKYRYCVYYTDIIGIDSLNKTKPIFYYDYDESRIGGVRVTEGNSKIIYTTFGIEGIADETKRNTLMKKMLQYLNVVSDVPENVTTSEMEIEISPNPAVDEALLKVSSTNTLNQYPDIRIIDLLGNKIVLPSVNLYSDNNEMNLRIDVRSLPSGMYYILLNANGNLFRKPLAVLK